MLGIVLQKLAQSKSARYLLNKWSNRPDFQPLYDVMSSRLPAGLRRLHDLGYAPDWIVDAGAYEGTWTTAAIPIFPNANFLMLEAQAEKAQFLGKVQPHHQQIIKYAICLLGDQESEEAEFFLAETGSSRYVENTAFPRTRTVLPMTRLDTILEKEDVRGTVLLKLDVQGAELDVLNGASQLLSGTNQAVADVILSEVSLANYNEGAPRVAQIIAYMFDHGYELWDIWDLRRIWSQDRMTSLLAQSDFVFVRSDSELAARSHHIVQTYGT